jgi:uncharacterized protein YcbK (DUF882 family)
MTNNFKRAEFACRCGCGLDAISPELVDGLQFLRDMIGKPMVVLSGCRCVRSNAAAKGAGKSQHLPGADGLCRAADVRVPRTPWKILYAIADKSRRFKGIGVYPSENFIHVDVRKTKARWARIDGNYVEIERAFA